MTDQLRVVHDAPPLLAGLLAQEIGELATITCPTCDGDGIAYAHSTSPRKTTCHECWGVKTVQVPASEILEPAEPTCFMCGGRQTWQGYDGAVEECTACAQQDAPHPDACTRCDTVTGEALTGAGLCRDCDVDDALADGWIPTHTGGLRAGPA